jgi:hypothetical protein
MSPNVVPGWRDLSGRGSEISKKDQAALKVSGLEYPQGKKINEGLEKAPAGT